MFKNIKFDVSEGVAKLVLARPPVNVLNIEMMKEINEALQSLQDKTDVKLLVISAEGKMFSAGVDVGEHTADKVNDMISTFHKMFRLLRTSRVPSLAVVHGSALGGGCELAIFCDMILASENSKFGQPEIKVGVFAPIACLAMTKILGPKKSFELNLTGDVIDAAEALRIGLVNKVVPADKLAGDAEEYVKKFMSLSAEVIAQTRMALNKAYNRSFEPTLSEIETLYLDSLMKTRKPEWKNR
jgi:cyclohexa-1,5-dienecarbonyl-CoA hydratase